MKRLSAVLGSLMAVLLVSAPVPVQAGARSAQDVVVSTTDEVIGALKAEKDKSDEKRVFGIIEQMIVPHFDFTKMSQWVLGKNWNRASPEEQTRFVEEFRRLLVRTYSTALMQYTDQKIEFLPFRADSGSDVVTVKTQVNRDAGPVIPIDYRLYQKDGEWKVFDVAIDGVSLVANYRTTFNQEIGTKGIGGLIDTLAARNRLQD